MEIYGNTHDLEIVAASNAITQSMLLPTYVTQEKYDSLLVKVYIKSASESKDYLLKTDSQALFFCSQLSNL